MASLRKVALVGTGMVGTSYAYALLNQNVCDELVLIDASKEKAWGEAMDLSHGLAFSQSRMKIYAGSYRHCADAQLLVLCAGAAQKPGQSRRELLQQNAEVFRSILQPVLQCGFSGIVLVATNPVDVMAQIAQTLCGFDARRVMGSGTTLDTARLRFLLGNYFDVDPRNVHAYVIGEHGDSEFVPWSQAMIATKPVLSICEETPGRDCQSDLSGIETEVRASAERIIRAKRATYYGIGMALVRITKAILGNENSVLTVSTLLQGEYGQQGVYTGVPCVVGSGGVGRVLQLPLTAEEQARFSASCEVLRGLYSSVTL